MKEKPASDSPFFGAFSGRIPKAIKDFNVCFFIRSFTLRDELIIIPANTWNFLMLLCV